MKTMGNQVFSFLNVTKNITRYRHQGTHQLKEIIERLKDRIQHHKKKSRLQTPAKFGPFTVFSLLEKYGLAQT